MLKKQNMPEKLTIDYLFTKAARCFPRKICFQSEKDGIWRRYTYAMVDKLSRKMAAFLVDKGIGKGDFVLLVLDNGPEWVVSYLGIIYSGACAVPVDPQMTVKEIENITADCKPKAGFISEQVLSKDNFKRLKSQLKNIITVGPVKEETNFIKFSRIEEYSVPRNFDFPEISPDDIASLIYTSGTTGAPKGVMLTHRNFCSNFKSLDKFNLCTEKDNVLSILPLFHSYAFMTGLLGPLLMGAKIIYCLSLRPEDITRAMRESGVTIMPAVPQIITVLRNKIFSKYDEAPAILKPLVLFFTRIRVRKIFGKNFRLFTSGGARLNPDIAKDISKLGIGMVEGYGLTETSPAATFNPPGKVKFGSVGKAIPDVEIKINNPDSSGIGEVLIKGPNVMSGYFKRPGLTQEVIKDGWFYSGDLGYIDSEGYLFITGRLKEVIVLDSGKNIYPEDIEVLYGSAPSIKELCVFSDGRKGLHALIVPDFLYLRGENITTVKDAVKWELENISRELPSHCRLMGFTIIKEELPRTRLGKIRRFELQEKYGKEKQHRAVEDKKYSEDDRLLVNQDVSRKILIFLGQKLKRKIIPDDHLEIDLGIDSLGRVELADELERLLKIKIPTELIAKVFTVRELLNEISAAGKMAPAGRIQKEGFNWKELLDKLPPEKVLSKVRLKPSKWDEILTFAFIKFVFCVFKVFFRLKVEGRENLPRKGPYILCPNHASYLDGLFVAISVPYKLELHSFFLGYAYYFEKPLIAWGIKLGRLISIDPNVHLVEAMQVSSYVLKNGKIMCLFPAGGRSIDENVQEFKKGVGILAKELDIPLVPVFIKGAVFAWPRHRSFPLPYPIKVVFGSPLSVTELLKKSKKGEKDDYGRITSALRDEVVKLKEIN
ncbi:MAG: AMP-binding protein [Candidatus Aureabacteria bacterium]|nr:AMP-binding protein [Candidatus Auribacterota bacterium]